MIDYLIIGQGIAGTVLSRTMLAHGKEVHVVDNAEPFSASRVAAGLFNPITGHRMVKTWRADALFTFLATFYRQFELKLGHKFYYPTPIYRPFGSIGQQNEILADLADPPFAPFVRRGRPAELYSQFVRDPFGGLELRQSGYVDVQTMLLVWQQHLAAAGRYTQADFAESELRLGNGQVQWRDITARKVIFCRGHHDQQSLWWGPLPYRPVKGEIVWVKFQGRNFSSIVNRGCWVLPTHQPNSTHERIYKVGATYDWKELNVQPTLAARQELTAKLGELISVPYEVVGQQAGIRPATADRKPFIGLHPEHPEVGIFGGLGAKGVSLAPFFAHQFYQFLELGGPLEPVVDIRRYFCA